MPIEASRSTEPGVARGAWASALDHLRLLLGRPIAFFPRLVPLTESAKATVMLGQLVYWTRHGSEITSSAGWFYKTAEQWRRETGLSLREQRSARGDLMSLGVLEERRDGMPAKLFYRLDLERLDRVLHRLPGHSAGAIEWGDAAQVSAHLGPASAFYPRLTEVTGGITTALALSRAIVLTRHEHTDPEGWIGKLPGAWMKESGLTLAQYRHARQRLRDTGLWSVTLRGVPAQLFVRVEHAVLKQRLEECGRLRRRPNDDAKAQFMPSQNVQSSLQESAQLDRPKPPDKIRHCGTASQAETPQLNIEVTTGFRLQTPPPRISDEALSSPRPRGGEELIFPTGLSSAQRHTASAMLGAVPVVAQDLLDELAARIAMNAVRTTPIGYLRALIERAKAGEFVLEAGAQVRALRRQREIDESQQRARDLEVEAERARRQSPEFQATLDRRRADIRQFLERSGHRARKDAS